MFYTVADIATKPSYWIIEADDGKLSRGPAEKMLLPEAVQRAFGMKSTHFRAITVGTRVSPIRQATFNWRLKEELKVHAPEFVPGIYEYDPIDHKLRRIGDWVGKYNIATGISWYHHLDLSLKETAKP